MAFMRVAGASSFVQRRSKRHAKLEPGEPDAGTPPKPAGVFQNGRSRSLFGCLR